MEMGGLSTVACSFNHSLGPQRNAHVKTERPGSLQAVKLPTRAKETIVLSSMFCYFDEQSRYACMYIHCERFSPTSLSIVKTESAGCA